MKLCLGQLTSNHPQLCKLIHGVLNFGKFGKIFSTDISEQYVHFQYKCNSQDDSSRQVFFDQDPKP